MEKVRKNERSQMSKYRQKPPFKRGKGRQDGSVGGKKKESRGRKLKKLEFKKKK